MTNRIKPIATRYAGVSFRSRLEARWAVFFDAMRVPWEYEPEGYVFDGGAYLPDFRLFGRQLIEIKPLFVLDEPESPEHIRAMTLQSLFQGDLMLLFGEPIALAYRLVVKESEHGIPVLFRAIFAMCRAKRPCLGYIEVFQNAWGCLDSKCRSEKWPDVLAVELIDAYDQAMGHRFGESNSPNGRKG